MEQNKELTRWRMILGEDTQQDFESMQEGFSLTDRDIMMDTALAAIYGGEGSKIKWVVLEKVPAVRTSQNG